MIDQPIPAILSINEGEPGYRSDWQDIGHDLDIFVDGVEQKSVVSYDCHAGTVTRHKRDANDRYIIEADEIALETITGVVEVLRQLK